MHLLGFAMLSAGWYWCGLVMLGLAEGRCGWLMHEGGHYSLTGNITYDRWIQRLTYGVGCGMSGCYWRNQHNKHHATPQKLGADPDLQTLPLLAFHTIIGKKAPKWWIRMQAPLFVSGPICCLVALGWQLVQHPAEGLKLRVARAVAWAGSALATPPPSRAAWRAAAAPPRAPTPTRSSPTASSPSSRACLTAASAWSP